MDEIDEALSELELFLLNALTEVAAKRSALQAMELPMIKVVCEENHEPDSEEVFDRR